MLGPLTDENVLIEIQNGLGGQRVQEPYIIWNTVGSNNLLKHDLLQEEHKVVLVIGDIVTNTSKSNPTGKDNDVLVKTNKNWT
jgi:hypothetical protein